MNNHFQNHQLATSVSGHAQPVPAKSGPSRSKQKLFSKVEDAQREMNLSFSEAAFYVAGQKNVDPETIGRAAQTDEADVQEQILRILRTPGNGAHSYEEAAQSLVDDFSEPGEISF